MRRKVSDLSVQAEFFATHLRAQGPRYFPEAGGVLTQVRLAKLVDRSASTLYHFDLLFGEQKRSVLIKVPIPGTSSRDESSPDNGRPDRPRLFPPVDPETKFRLEYDALTAIKVHYARLEDKRFGVIRTFEVLPAQRAVIMEAVYQPSLRDLVAPPIYVRPSIAGSDLERVFHNAGAWLRSYHALPVPPQIERGEVNRAVVVNFIGKLADYLAARAGDCSFFSRVVEATTMLARASLPTRLPTGLMHGDYAMRNLLVGDDGRITVLDTLGTHCGPTYFDLGVFLSNFKSGWRQVLVSGTTGQMDGGSEYERAFLSSYFAGELVPRAAICVFEICANLDKWASLVAYRQRAKNVPSRASRLMRLQFMSWLLRRAIENTLASLQEMDTTI